jgi:hypothetical protein
VTCKHQWADATTKAGPEWVCAKCGVNYSDTKKTPPAKRGWVGLTNEQFIDLCEEASNFGTVGLIRHIEAKLKEKNDL